METVKFKMMCCETICNLKNGHLAQMHPVIGKSENSEKIFSGTYGGMLLLKELKRPFFQQGKEYIISIEEVLCSGDASEEPKDLPSARSSDSGEDSDTCEGPQDVDYAYSM
ncbi:MAG: hypothetical protein KAS32_14890 [Candidatus Peribacteraceae bacterium]|nr:hypothetical protein [Candidatus Peribacteraceae bacterium]